MRWQTTFVVVLAIARAAGRIEPVPTTNEEFAQMMGRISYKNQTLLDYFFPANPIPSKVEQNFWPSTQNCHMRPCWCMHVRGSLDKAVNPNPEACEVRGPALRRPRRPPLGNES